MTFNSVNLQFKTVSDFAAWLALMARPSWVRGSTYHNTYRPTEAQWRGKASMESMQATYVGKGWTSGPHLYIALHSPNPADDGIWAMTPPTVPGTHAGGCNPVRFGVEVVGDFQNKAPSAAQQQLLIDALTALHRWAHIGPDLNAHRDCMSDRTCPGDAFYALKPQLQQRLAQALTTDRLKARQIPGPPNTPPRYCSEQAADFYAARGGLVFCGYPLADEFHDAQLNCDVFPCQRVCIKESAAYGVEQALLKEEAIPRGWLS